MAEADVRQKEIVYSSRTRAATDQYKKMQKLRIALANVIKRLPEELKSDPDVQLLEQEIGRKSLQHRPPDLPRAKL